MRTLLILLSLLPSLARADTFPAEGRKAAQVYVPDQYTPAEAWPVVVLLHGYLGNDSLIDSYFGFSAEVSRRGFILVVPNGRADSSGEQFWNASGGCCDFDHSNSDDVGYIKKLLREVRVRYHVDPARIFAAGHSNGAFLAHRLACEADAPVAAIVSFAGEAGARAADCRPPRPVSVLQIHAVDDDTIHYAGDPKGYPKLAPYPGTVETMARWVALDHCGRASVKDGVKHITAGNETSAQHWQGCTGGARVALWTIQASSAPWHTPHTPMLTDEFTSSVLDFLLRP